MALLMVKTAASVCLAALSALLIMALAWVAVV